MSATWAKPHYIHGVGFVTSLDYETLCWLLERKYHPAVAAIEAHKIIEASDAQTRRKTA